MLPQEIIRHKRDGATLDDAQIEQFVAGLVDGTVSEGQAAAFAMAVYFNGMSTPERVALTRAMMRSGTVLRWEGLDGTVVDKHSTGGVGDTVSLMLAPAVAVCGAHVPMISGRGLGHTGGTLDKMASIPGYRVAPTYDEFTRTVTEIGCAIIGQTADLAPADGRLYAVRDVTATVESIPLIVASILSKKLAAGLDALVMDVKYGNGAFMSEYDQARELADALVEVATGAGLATTAILTAMDQPLASSAGNALEVLEAIDYLTGVRRGPRLHEVVVELGGEMLVLARLASDRASGRRAIEQAIASGAAAERFAQMVSALGGPNDLMERPRQVLAQAPIEYRVAAEQTGSVAGIDTRAVGLVVVALGGGRTRPQDPIDPAVGLSALAAIGDRIGPDDDDAPLAIVHARTLEAARAAEVALRRAYRLAPE